MGDKKYYINNLDSYIGKQFLTQLRGTEEEPSGNEIIGTKLDRENFDKLPGQKKCMKPHLKPLLFKDYLKRQDVIIYDTLYGDPTEVRTAIQTFQKPGLELENPKVLILLSSIRSWSGISKKEVFEEEEKEEDDEDVEQDADGNPIPKEKEDGEEGDENAENDGDENYKLFKIIFNINFEVLQ